MIWNEPSIFFFLQMCWIANSLLKKTLEYVYLYQRNRKFAYWIWSCFPYQKIQVHWIANDALTYTPKPYFSNETGSWENGPALMVKVQAFRAFVSVIEIAGTNCLCDLFIMVCVN